MMEKGRWGGGMFNKTSLKLACTARQLMAWLDLHSLQFLLYLLTSLISLRENLFVELQQSLWCPIYESIMGAVP